MDELQPPAGAGSPRTNQQPRLSERGWTWPFAARHGSRVDKSKLNTLDYPRDLGRGTAERPVDLLNPQNTAALGSWSGLGGARQEACVVPLCWFYQALSQTGGRRTHQLVDVGLLIAGLGLITACYYQYWPIRKHG